MLIAIVIIVVVAAAVAVVLILAASKPDTFRVQRTATVMAGANKVFPLIDDFRQWGTWSPWEKLDPTMRKTYHGEESGKGAVYEWEGNGKAGAGRMEILEASPPGKVVIKLDFIKPFEGHNVAEFTMVPEGEGTEITWAMHGPCPFVAKIMHVFINMDKMIGKDFETGLANLKAITEQSI
jgi:hypothetical protein